MDREQRYFIKEVGEQAQGTHNRKPVEIMYRVSGKKVSIWSSMKDGEVSIDNMRLMNYSHSLHVDEDKLAQDLGRIFNKTSYTKETKSYPNG
jgi:hypothetical protein